MDGKTPAETSVCMAYLMLPQDANPAGNIHGGVVLKYIDTAAAVAAMRHARMNVVTASIDRTDFLNPVFVGELATFKASVNFVGRTSLEVGVRVEAENLFTGEVRHTNSAYITFVALGPDGKPAAVPPLLPQTDDEVRRVKEASIRRKLRTRNREVDRCLED